MYIKFCRGYVVDKKEDVKERLSVELEAEKEKQAGGNARLYRMGCLFLTTLCLILLMVVIVLCMKLGTGSTVCPEKQETATGTQSCPTPPACSCEQCQAQHRNSQPRSEETKQGLGCSQCADGWLTFGRSCFFLSTFRLSWDESQRHCAASGGSLAAISSRGMQNFLTKQRELKYWIGLRLQGDAWTWVNGTGMQESYWSKDETSGDCGILDGTRPQGENWIKASCQAYTYFICQLRF